MVPFPLPLVYKLKNLTSMTAWTGTVLESLEKYVQIHLCIHFIHKLINPGTKIFEKALVLSWGTKNNENYKGQYLHQHSTKNRTALVGQALHTLGDCVAIHINISKQLTAPILQ